MKVFVSTDLEGASGIVARQEVLPDIGGKYYDFARRRLTADVNAAVQGALDGGATELVVADAHAESMNILYEELHPRAELVRGTNSGHRPLLILETIDPSFDLVLLVGYHAPAGDWPGILSHTYSSLNFSRVRFNGVEVSEARIGAAIAGAYGVPVGMISGDDRTCAEAASWLPGIESAVVKYAIDRFAARCLPAPAAIERIRQAAATAVRRRGDFRPVTFSSPTRLEVSFFDVSLAYRATVIPGVTRTAPDTVAYEGKDFLEAQSAFRAILYVAIARPTL